ncbi:hypothetical protein BH20ACT24_BH20ACT24_04460 [soil metagenome]
MHEQIPEMKGRGNMRGIRVIVALLVCVVMSSCAGLSSEGKTGPAGEDASAGSSAGYLRVVKTFERPWQVACSGEECGSAGLASFDTPLPRGVESFDVTVTVTMDYTLSASDTAQLHVFHCPNDSPPVPCPIQFLPPDLLPLSSSVDPTTTTLSWAGRNFGAGGFEGWHYQLEALVFDGSGDSKARMSGSKMTVVVEMTRG